MDNPIDILADGHGIVISGWKIETAKHPISTISENDNLSADLEIPLPEMIFSKNFVKISNEQNGISFLFDAKSALENRRQKRLRQSS